MRACAYVYVCGCCAVPAEDSPLVRDICGAGLRAAQGHTQRIHRVRRQRQVLGCRHHRGRSSQNRLLRLDPKTPPIARRCFPKDGHRLETFLKPASWQGEGRASCLVRRHRLFAHDQTKGTTHALGWEWRGQHSAQLSENDHRRLRTLALSSVSVQGDEDCGGGLRSWVRTQETALPARVNATAYTATHTAMLTEITAAAFVKKSQSMEG